MHHWGSLPLHSGLAAFYTFSFSFSQSFLITHSLQNLNHFSGSSLNFFQKASGKIFCSCTFQIAFSLMPVSLGMRHTLCRLPDWGCSAFITPWSTQRKTTLQFTGTAMRCIFELTNLVQFAKTSEISLSSPLLLWLLESFYAQSRHFNCLDAESSFYCVFYRP